MITIIDCSTALLLLILVSGSLGTCSGRYLARRGVTADNALQHHQRQVYQGSCTALGLITLLAVLLTAGRRSPWTPDWLLLYAGAHIWDFILAVCCFCVGFLLVLELPGWKEAKRLPQGYTAVRPYRLVVLTDRIGIP